MIFRRLLLFALPALAFTASRPDDGVFRKLYTSNHGKHYKNLSFKQNTERYRNDTLVSSTVWTEVLQFPDKLRIDVGDPADKNTTLYLGDTTFTFRNGTLYRKTTLQNDLIFLLGGMYFYPYDQTVAKFKALGFDADKSFSATWKGKPVDVVGATAEGQNINQIWIDREKQVIVRMLQFSGGRKQECVMDGHLKFGSSYAETLVHFYVDGKLLQAEKYFDVKADVEVDVKTFDPSAFK